MTTLLPRELEKKLHGLARRAWILDCTQGTMLVGRYLCLLLFIQTLLDEMLDLPWGARLMLLIVDLTGLVWLVRRAIFRPWRSRMDEKKAALLVQKKWPELRGSLIASVELAAPDGRNSPLIQSIHQRTIARIRSLNFAEVVPARRYLYGIAVSLLVILPVFTCAILFSHHSRILLERLCLLSVPLPAKTQVEPLTRDIRSEYGGDVIMSARAHGLLPRHALISIIYANGQRQEMLINPSLTRPEVFTLSLKNIQQSFDYQFTLNDGRGKKYRVLALLPPIVQSLQIEQVYPDYTGLGRVKRIPEDLSILLGSTLHLHILANMALGAATVELHGLPDHPSMTLDVMDDKQASLDLPIQDKNLTGFSISLKSSQGQMSRQNTLYPVEVVLDQPPNIQLRQPSEENVLVTLAAKIKVAWEVGDDFGLSKLDFCYQWVPAVRSGSREIAAPSPVGRVSFDPTRYRLESGHPTLITYLFDLAAQNQPWNEGDVIDYWIEAVDNNTATGPGISKTPVCHLHIVSLEKKREDVLQRIGDSESAIKNVIQDQDKLNQQLGKIIENK